MYEPLITGPVIRELRTNAMLSQQNIADKVGVSRSTIARLENAGRKLKECEYDLVASSLLISKDDLIETFEYHKFQREAERAAEAYRADVEEKKEKAANNRTFRSKKEILKILRNYFQEKRVKEVALFGSVAREEHTTHSDIDILVEFEDDFEYGLFDHAKIHVELQELTGYSVDVVIKGTEYEHIKPSLNRDKILIVGKENRTESLGAA